MNGTFIVLVLIALPREMVYQISPCLPGRKAGRNQIYDSRGPTCILSNCLVLDLYPDLQQL